MSEGRMTFIDACLKGEAKPEDIWKFIGKWHKTDPDAVIIDILGMTPYEHCLWLQNGSYIFNVLGRRAVARAQTRMVSHESRL
jgi:hypothetical protein